MTATKLKTLIENLIAEFEALAALFKKSAYATKAAQREASEVEVKNSFRKVTRSYGAVAPYLKALGLETYLVNPRTNVRMLAFDQVMLFRGHPLGPKVIGSLLSSLEQAVGQLDAMKSGSKILLKNSAVETPEDHSPLALTNGIKRFESSEILDGWMKASSRLSSDLEGAVTSARSLLEQVCKHILDELEKPCDESWDLPILVNAAVNSLKLSPKGDTEDSFKQLMGGAKSIAKADGSIRNKLGDAHGKRKGSERTDYHHAELIVNMSGSVSIFLLACLEKKLDRSGPV